MYREELEGYFGKKMMSMKTRGRHKEDEERVEFEFELKCFFGAKAISQFEFHSKSKEAGVSDSCFQLLWNIPI